MTTPNIERFNEVTGLLLAHLYEHFPVPQDIEAGEFVDNATVPAKPIPGVISPYFEDLTTDGTFFVSAVEWLATAGFLTFDKRFNSEITGVVLSEKGLQTLNAVPESLTASAPLGERLVDAAKSGGKEVLKATLREVLSAGMKLVIPS